MQKFSLKLLTEWRNLELPFSDKNIIIAVSGGADSCALAFSINDLVKRKKLLNNFAIAHFNHNLRGEESIADLEFVKDLADKLDFEFISATAKKDEINAKSNIEQSARIARYDFLLKAGKKLAAQSVLTAHTKNDQAETFLLNLLRGSGIAGLSAIKSIRKLKDKDEILLARPLLNWATREDIENFVENSSMFFRQDTMNQNFSFKRVQIRKKLIPYLKTFNPNIVETLANSSQVIGDENRLIEELLSRDSTFQRLINMKTLKLAELKSLSDAMIYKVLRHWLANKRGSLRGLEFAHIEAVEKLINSRKSGKIVELPNFQRVIKENGKLIFQDTEVEK